MTTQCVSTVHVLQFAIMACFTAGHRYKSCRAVIDKGSILHCKRKHMVSLAESPDFRVVYPHPSCLTIGSISQHQTLHWEDKNNNCGQIWHMNHAKLVSRFNKNHRTPQLSRAHSTRSRHHSLVTSYLKSMVETSPSIPRTARDVSHAFAKGVASSLSGTSLDPLWCVQQTSVSHTITSSSAAASQKSSTSCAHHAVRSQEYSRSAANRVSTRKPHCVSVAPRSRGGRRARGWRGEIRRGGRRRGGDRRRLHRHRRRCRTTIVARCCTRRPRCGTTAARTTRRRRPRRTLAAAGRKGRRCRRSRSRAERRSRNARSVPCARPPSPFRRCEGAT